MKFNFLQKLIIIFISAFLLLGVFIDNSSAQSDAQSKLMAKRAAKVDALRNLMETVYGIQIDSHTTVSDFVTQSDTIKAKVSAVIQGAREVDYRVLQDGTAEVTVEITLGTVEDILGRRIQYIRRTVEATGYGAPSGEPARYHSESSGSLLRAKGSGIEPDDPNMSLAEKSLMAKRAAKLDALRNLVEQIYGTRITSSSTVKDFVLQSDEVRGKVNAFVEGARVVSEQMMPDGSYQAEVEIDIDPLKNILVVR